MTSHQPPSVTFDEAERAQLQGWLRLSPSARLEFFEEMIELAYQSGALKPERLALREAEPAQDTPDEG